MARGLRGGAPLVRLLLLPPGRTEAPRSPASRLARGFRISRKSRMVSNAAVIPEDRVAEGSRIGHELRVQRFYQPDDVTCGPTCLRKVYDFFGHPLELSEVLGEIDRNDDGGTLAVFLGIAALRRGFRARIFAYDMRIFDPSWFALPAGALAEKIHARIPYLKRAKAVRAAQAYLTFLELGGELAFDELTPGLLKSIIDREHPVLAGLSATYLYRMPREREVESGALVIDDVRGEPTGHFVVICGYEHWGRRFLLRDPSEHVPDLGAGDPDRQTVDVQRLINAILLGDLTYDAVLLELWPGSDVVPGRIDHGVRESA